MPKRNDSATLSEAEVEAAAPRASEWALSDGDGLSLVVRPDGARRWLFRYSVNGQRGKIWLGYYPDVELSAARLKRADAAALVAAGKDPRAVRRVERVKARQVSATTFEGIALEWHGKQKGRWTPDHAERVLDSLKADAFPDLGLLPIGDLTAPLILSVVQRIEERGAIETAQRVLQRIGAIIRYAIAGGRATTDPTYRLSTTLTAVKVQHRPAMPRKELPEYFRRLAAEPLYPLTRCGLDLLALTFVRPGELRGARWEEIDLKGKEWRIPAERMKARAAHIVPLSRQAIAVLKEATRYSEKSEFVFPAQTGRDKFMSENTLSYALGRMGYAGIHCPHGFRALASTILNEEGFDADVIERQLAHAERNKVRAAYHRASYLPERRKMMQWWADFLDRQRKIKAAPAGRRQ